MRTIDVSEVTALVRKLCIDANYYLPADLRQAFVDGQQSEQSPLGREIFGEMIAIWRARTTFRSARTPAWPSCSRRLDRMCI